MNLRWMLPYPWLVLALGACSPPPADPPPPDQGRAETRVIESADGLGYAGKPVRKKLDGALDTNDQRVDQLDRNIDAQSQ